MRLTAQYGMTMTMRERSAIHGISDPRSSGTHTAKDAGERDGCSKYQLQQVQILKHVQ